LEGILGEMADGRAGWGVEQKSSGVLPIAAKPFDLAFAWRDRAMPGDLRKRTRAVDVFRHNRISLDDRVALRAALSEALKLAGPKCRICQHKESNLEYSLGNPGYPGRTPCPA